MEIVVKDFKVGQREVGTVIAVEKDVIYLDIAAMCDAKIDKEHYSYDSKIEDFRDVVKIGDELKVMITFVSDEQILGSRLPFEKETKFEELKEKMKNEEPIKMTFSRFNRGGLEERNVFTYFMPKSQIGVADAEPKDFVGKEFEVVITDMDEKRQQLVVSARKLANKAQYEQLNKVWEELEDGQVIEGEITNIVSAGAEFRYKDTIRGFIPRRELSYLRIENLEEAFKVGDKIEVQVIELKKNKQIIASKKRLEPTPWGAFAEANKVDGVIKGTVKRLVDFGAFVEVAPGVEGLLHVSEVSYDPSQSMKDLIAEGDEVEAKILVLDSERRRLSLSVKRLEADPWDTLWKDYKVGDIITGPVKRIEDRHLWVSVVQYVDAILYKNEAVMKENYDLSDAFNIGDEIEVQIIEIDPRRRRIGVSQQSIVREQEQQQLEEYQQKMQDAGSDVDTTMKDKFAQALGKLED